MNLDAFLELVKGLGPWNLAGHWGIAIRTPDGLCPLQKVHLAQSGELLEGTAFVICGNRLGLSRADTGRVFRAADTEHDDKEVRQRLLTACGL